MWYEYSKSQINVLDFDIKATGTRGWFISPHKAKEKATTIIIVIIVINNEIQAFFTLIYPIPMAIPKNKIPACSINSKLLLSYILTYVSIPFFFTFCTLSSYEITKVKWSQNKMKWNEIILCTSRLAAKDSRPWTAAVVSGYVNAWKRAMDWRMPSSTLCSDRRRED